MKICLIAHHSMWGVRQHKDQINNACRGDKTVSLRENLNSVTRGHYKKVHYRFFSYVSWSRRWRCFEFERQQRGFEAILDTRSVLKVSVGLLKGWHRMIASECGFHFRKDYQMLMVISLWSLSVTIPNNDAQAMVVLILPTFVKRAILANSMANSGVSTILSLSTFEHLLELNRALT